jgi:hypothetical protein
MRLSEEKMQLTEAEQETARFQDAVAKLSSHPSHTASSDTLVWFLL